ncbi:MAG: 3-methyl-2-oxobutanoate hydroxymethyltransferase [Candidatus Cloacimonetes bacterium]|nr:3-methyl-2-oxobutanoate hydroxymethyltransferase [Candidatus Cloacimonadota bacterium]
MHTIRTLRKMKEEGRKIVMITAYDYPSGRFLEQAGVDVILVGDSLGMVVLGYKDTLQVKVEDILHHTRAVRRGAADTFIIADMPYLSYHLNLEQTRLNAARLIVEGGANAVKLEGGKPTRLEAIRAITEIEIPVVAHLGLTPQSINSMGGYLVQGKSKADHDTILDQAKAIEQAGASLLVLEGIPEKLGDQITRELVIPTVGIGAGRLTDGQVLVYNDLLGMSENLPRFVRSYDDLKTRIPDKLTSFCRDVREGRFPGEENVYSPCLKQS